MMRMSAFSRFVTGLTIAAFAASEVAVVSGPASAQQSMTNGTVNTPMSGGVGAQSPMFGDSIGFSGSAPPGSVAVPGNLLQTPRAIRQPPPVVANSCQRNWLQQAALSRPPDQGPAPWGAGPPVTQVAVQGGAAQGAQAPGDPNRPNAGGFVSQPLGPEDEELSRIEIAFNADLAQIAGGQYGGLMQFGRQPSGPRQSPEADTDLAQVAGGQYGGPVQFGRQLSGPRQNPEGQPDVQQPTGRLGLLQPASLAQASAFGAPGAPPLRQYGYTMFATSVSTFAPVDDIPVGPDYVVGPGDDLSINIWGPIDGAVVRTVDRNGRIVLPKVGDLRVWGLTFAQADRLIREQLSRYFRGFQTSVTMGRLRAVRVYVVGEVCQPGAYTLSSLSTLANALFSAGGPTKLGSLRDVRLLRNHHTVGTLDLYDFLLRGDRTHDFRLESGDTIFVPTVGDVAAVAGEVKRPAIYEVRGADRLSDLLDMAGGLTPRGYLKRVQIVRSQASAERVTTDVDLSQYYLKGDEASNPPVNAGDLVLIHRADQRIYNTVRVEGAVKYPGAYELKPLMRISHLLPAEKLMPEAFTERVEIARRRDDLSIEILAVNLKKAWTGDLEQDVLLRPLDDVAVRTELRAVRTVTLTGQVVRPGTYVIAEGERLSSVLERAGGFNEKAFLKGAVFTRAQLRRVEQEQLDAFVRLQEQRILAEASTKVIGGDREEAQTQQSTLQARRDMLRALASRVGVGRMVVRLDAPAALRGNRSDIVLVDGDTVNVPESPSSVLVVGAVRNSTSVLHKDDANVDYYVNQVGGFTKEADRKGVHIAKADGSTISSFTNIRSVDAGDTIIVPPKEEEKIRVLPTIRDVVQLAGSALLSIAALAVLF